MPLPLPLGSRQSSPEEKRHSGASFAELMLKRRIELACEIPIYLLKTLFDCRKMTALLAQMGNCCCGYLPLIVY